VYLSKLSDKTYLILGMVKNTKSKETGKCPKKNEVIGTGGVANHIPTISFFVIQVVIPQTVFF
jgi:hypothetical protein